MKEKCSVQDHPWLSNGDIIDLPLRNSKWKLKGRQRFIFLMLTNGSAWNLISVLLSFGWLSSTAQRREVVKCEQRPVCSRKLSVGKRRTRSDDLGGRLKMEIILLQIYFVFLWGVCGTQLMEGILLWESQILKGKLWLAKLDSDESKEF